MKADNGTLTISKYEHNIVRKVIKDYLLDNTKETQAIRNKVMKSLLNFDFNDKMLLVDIIDTEMMREILLKNISNYKSKKQNIVYQFWYFILEIQGNYVEYNSKLRNTHSGLVG